MSAHRSSVRLMVCCCTAVALVGCAKTDSKPAATDSAAGAVAPAGAPAAAPTPAAPAPIVLADIAGKWNVVAIPTAGDTTPTKFVLTVAATPDGWTQTYQNGLVVKPKIVVNGDSIVSDAGPYASVRRKGVKVVTHSVLRREGDKLVGTSTAHYQGVKGADSVLTLRTEGTRAP
jgi:hypothetical protein